MTIRQSDSSEPPLYDACRARQLFRRSPAPQGSRRQVALLAGLLLCASMPTAPLHAQQDTQPQYGATAQQSHPGAPGEPLDPLGPRMEHQMAQRRNDERQKQLVADTDKLLALAQQLKAEVDKSSKDQLSIDVVKRAAEIEKLAKSVKDKMKGY